MNVSGEIVLEYFFCFYVATSVLNLIWSKIISVVCLLQPHRALEAHFNGSNVRLLPSVRIHPQQNFTQLVKIICFYSAVVATSCDMVQRRCKRALFLENGVGYSPSKKMLGRLNSCYVFENRKISSLCVKPARLFQGSAWADTAHLCKRGAGKVLTECSVICCENTF